MDSENLSSLIRLSVSDGQKTDSSKAVSVIEQRDIDRNRSPLMTMRALLAVPAISDWYTMISVLTLLSLCCQINTWPIDSNENTTTPIDSTAINRITAQHQQFCRIEDICNPSAADDRNMCCSDCSCQFFCYDKGTCCPEMFIFFGNVLIPTLETEMTQYQCLPTSYRGFSPKIQYNFMIAVCPGNFTKSEIKIKCENRMSASSLIDVLPVDDLTTNTTYANKFCAECNGVSKENLGFWESAVRCDVTNFTPKSYSTILTEINKTPDCDIDFYPLTYQSNSKCYISACNTTGLWKHYDLLVEQACFLYLAPYRDMYRNPFCAICNGFNSDDFQIDDSCDEAAPGGASFVALLDFRPDQQEEERVPVGKCTTLQIYDPIMDVCHDLLCDVGRIYRNGSCVSAFKHSMGLCFKISIQLEEIHNMNGMDKHSDSVQRDHDSFLPADLFIDQILHVASMFGVEECLTNVSFYKDRNMYTETTFVKIFFTMEMYVDDGPFFNKFNDLYNDNIITLSAGHIQPLNRFSYRAQLVRLKEDSVSDGIVSPFTGDILTPYYSYNHTSIYGFYSDCADQNIITVTPMYFSPFVRINISSYTSWIFDNSGVHIDDINLFIGNALFRETENGTAIDISAEVYFDAVNKVIEMSGLKSLDAEGLSSLVLSSISSVCLLFTILTYLLYRDLRSQPGVNNLILCLCLFTAYILFIFGIDEKDLGICCQLIGGAIHLTWVLSFFWMSVCSWHMFRVFGSFFRPELLVPRVTLTLAYILYAVGATSFIVILNISLTFYTTNGASYGYGPGKTGLCYIYEPMMVLYTIAAPALTVVLLNITMFTVVVLRLRKTPNIQKHVHHDRIYFSVYIKLSTITGMAWIVAIPMMLLRMSVFNYIFIVLTCSQGIYVMVAFTCNRRVFKLYMEKLGTNKIRDNQTGTSS